MIVVDTTFGKLAPLRFLENQMTHIHLLIFFTFLFLILEIIVCHLYLNSLSLSLYKKVKTLWP